jgi:hypothetical protein
VAQKETAGLNEGGRPKTLASQGIDKNLEHQARAATGEIDRREQRG